MRSCSGTGGTGIGMRARFALEIRCRVEPLCRAVMAERICGALATCISHLGSGPMLPGRTMHTSTTVTHWRVLPGKMHARPNGCGIRAMRMSFSRSIVQRRTPALVAVRKRDDLSRKAPSPTSASCMRRTSPSGSWSFVSTQSPSTKTPSSDTRSLIVDSIHPGGICVTEPAPRSIHPTAAEGGPRTIGMPGRGRLFARTADSPGRRG